MKRAVAYLRGAARGLLSLALLATLAGCILDPVPEWDFTFQGTVRRADTGAPVPGARVEIRLARPDDTGSDAPWYEAQTNASGEFVFRQRERNRAQPPNATIRVTPPAGSGLATRTEGGSVQEVFTAIDRSGRSVTYTADIALTP